MEWTTKGNWNDYSFEVVEKVTIRKAKYCYNTVTILANNPITTLDTDYFEVKLLEKDSDHDETWESGSETLIAIGLGPKDFNLDFGGLMPGESIDDPSIVYHCGDGQIFYDGSPHIGNPVNPSVNDVIGCGVDYYGYCYFTVNGKRLEAQESSRQVNDMILYPLITLGRTNTEIIANFGQDAFLYKQPKQIKIFGQWMEEMRNSKKSGSHVFHNHLTDVTLVSGRSYNSSGLVSGDGEEFSCHKLVLSLRSPVFKEMVKVSSIINVGEFDATTVKQMINFLYTDSIEWDDESINYKLLDIAKKYEIEEMKRVLAGKLFSQINLKNVLEFWSNQTLLARNEKILRECGDFIQKNWEDVKETKAIISLLKNDEKAALMLMVDIIGNHAIKGECSYRTNAPVIEHLKGLLFDSTELQETSD